MAHWHIHTHDPQIPPELQGFRVIPTAIDVEADPASPLQAHPAKIQWPKAQPIEVAFTGEPVMYKVYTGRAVAYLPVTVAKDAPLGEATLKVSLTYQACDDKTCLRKAEETHTVTLKIVSPQTLASQGKSGASDGGASALFTQFDPSVWQGIRSSGGGGGGGVGAGGGASPMLVSFDLFGWHFELDIASGVGLALLLLVAALGGFLLNLTPCVLPMIPLKIMGLSQMAGSRSRCWRWGR